MKKKLSLILGALIAISSVCTFFAYAQSSESEREALKVVDALFTAFNKKDSAGYFATFHYPQGNISEQGGITVSQAPPERGMDFEALTAREGWHHSVLDSAKVIDSSANKVHIDVRFTRFKADGSAYAKIRGLWIVTKREGKWGIQLRSFMPTENPAATK